MKKARARYRRRKKKKREYGGGADRYMFLRKRYEVFKLINVEMIMIKLIM